MRNILIVSIVVLSLAGCNQFLAERMVAPPNELRPHLALATQSTAERRALRIPVGPPGAMLAAWVLEPKAGVEVRGTILVLHGFLVDHLMVEDIAGRLRDEGYRAVMIDLRGHGESTGEHITFGVLDAQDLARAADYLQKNDLCGGTLGVYGTSYGAASAILFAASDPRVTAVVAVAPFATLREEAPHFGRVMLPFPGRFLSNEDYTVIVNAAGRIAAFDPDACNPLAAIPRTKARVLLVHGDLDVIIPCEASRQLHAAAPDTTELNIVRGQGHLILCGDLLGSVREPARQWFDRYLATSTVPRTALSGHSAGE